MNLGPGAKQVKLTSVAAPYFAGLDVDEESEDYPGEERDRRSEIGKRKADSGKFPLLFVPDETCNLPFE